MARPARRLLLLIMTCGALALTACTQRAPTPSTASAPPPPAPMTASGKVKVAMLLPLNGRAEALGKAMQEAAELALFDGAGRSIAISTYDTGDTAQGAIDAFNRARAEGTALILGPLFGASARAIAPQAREANLSILSFSNDEQVAQPGLWVMGLAAGPQIRRVVDYSMSRGYRTFGVVAPQTAYGQQTAAAFADHVRVRNGQLVGREFFDQGGDAAAAARKVATSLGSGTDVAVFLPVSGQSLAPAISGLSAGGGKRPQLLGTGVWDDLEIWQMGSLSGAWYAAPDPANRADFDRRFTATYGKPAPRLATLAYDAVRFAGRLATRRQGGDFSVEAITEPAGFAGADGMFRFMPDGRTERLLAIIEVGNQRSTVVSPAPSSFERPSF